MLGTQLTGSLFVEFQNDFDVFAAVEARYGMCRSGKIAVFRVNFVVHIRVEAAEAVDPRTIRDVRLHILGSEILEVHDAIRNGILMRVEHGPMDRSQLRLFLLLLFVLRTNGERNAQNQHSREGANYGAAA